MLLALSVYVSVFNSGVGTLFQPQIAIPQRYPDFDLFVERAQAFLHELQRHSNRSGRSHLNSSAVELL
jgi:hypothetical protein